MSGFPDNVELVKKIILINIVQKISLETYWINPFCEVRFLRSDSSNLQRAGKDLFKESIWYLFNRYEQGDEKNICLFSTRRGGSTHLMELIATNRGVRFCDQPFSLNSSLSGQVRHLPIFDRSQVISLNEDDEAMIRTYLEKIFSGVLNVQTPWRFWRRDFDFLANRLVLKIVDAKGIIDWVDRNFPVYIVYSTRHPIPTVLSIMRNQWGLTARAYLHDHDFVRNYLDPDQADYAECMLLNGTLFQKHILNWCLENMIALRLIAQRPHWLYISYEALILNPDETIEKLSKYLHLADILRMREKISRPSKSTRDLSTTDARAAIKDGDGCNIISRWRRELSRQEERVAFDILDRLDITVYQYGSDVPVGSE